MKNQLSAIQEIISELAVENASDLYSTLPEVLKMEFLKIQASLLQIWATRPTNLEDILDFNYYQAGMLMSKMSTYTVDRGEINGYVKGVPAFRYTVTTAVLDGLLGVINLIMYLRDGNNRGLGLQMDDL